jgi:RNA polymerase sigma factor (sigma-70 family)
MSVEARDPSSPLPGSREVDAERRGRFERVFDAHYRAVSAYALRRAGNAEAEDAVAETFLIAWRRLDDIPADAKPWLLGVARRVLANQHRAAARRSALNARVAHQRPLEPEWPRAELILRALDGLSESDRELLLLFAWEGLSVEELAGVLHCSRTAVKVRLHRARRRLRSQLTEAERAEVQVTATPRLEQSR